jgi:hypothetical protein
MKHRIEAGSAEFLACEILGLFDRAVLAHDDLQRRVFGIVGNAGDHHQIEATVDRLQKGRRRRNPDLQ